VAHAAADLRRERGAGAYAGGGYCQRCTSANRRSYTRATWEPYLAGRLDRDLTEPVGAGTLQLSKEDGFDEAAQGLLI
jgi:hypothetical protein